jgi:hypothetical protein
MEHLAPREWDPAALAVSERRLMGAILGLEESDPALEELHASGFRPSNVALLDVMPLVELAWADGRVSPRERQIVTAAAARRRDVRGSAHTQLAWWLAERPPESTFRACRNTLRRAMRSLAGSAAARMRVTLETEISLMTSSAGGLLDTEALVPEAQRTILLHLLADLGMHDLPDAR